jgi:hypothetical protein
MLLAEDISGLLGDRPDGSTTIVYNDGLQDWPFNKCLTDEYGVCVLSYGDSHDILTGSNQNGTLYSSDSRHTCGDWTDATDSGVSNCGQEAYPIIGHAWPRSLSGNAPNWISEHLVAGCSANINLANTMECGVGGHGGYGAWYCFAVVN